MFACTTYRKPPLSFSQSTGFSITIVASRMVHGLYVECWPEPYMQKLLPANHSMIVQCTMYGVLVECSRAIHFGYCSENILCFLNYSWNNMQVLCSKTIQPPSSDPTLMQNIARLLHVPCDIQSELQLFITIITAYANRMVYMMHERYFYSFHFFSEIYVHSSMHTLYIGSHQCHSINELQFFITIVIHAVLVTVHSGMLTLPIGSYYPCCPPIVTVVTKKKVYDASNLCLKHGFPFLNLYHYSQEIG